MTVADGYRLAIDIGGTFTDVVLLDTATQRLIFVKAPTTPADRSLGFFAGIEACSRRLTRLPTRCGRSRTAAPLRPTRFWKGKGVVSDSSPRLASGTCSRSAGPTSPASSPTSYAGKNRNGSCRWSGSAPFQNVSPPTGRSSRRSTRRRRARPSRNCWRKESSRWPLLSSTAMPTRSMSDGSKRSPARWPLNCLSLARRPCCPSTGNTSGP